MNDLLCLCYCANIMSSVCAFRLFSFIIATNGARKGILKENWAGLSFSVFIGDEMTKCSQHATLASRSICSMSVLLSFFSILSQVYSYIYTECWNSTILKNQSLANLHSLGCRVCP